jgi:hypothetical protein
MSAWAIIIDGEIDIRTVMPTDISAMVNWIVVSCGAIIQQGVTDQNVRAAFDAMKEKAGASVECCPVEIRRALQ